MRLLTVNTGSSSLKAALYEMGPAETLGLTAHAERIGSPGGRLRILDAQGAALLDEARDQPDHEAALEALIDWLRRRDGKGALDAVGHRVVHGGARYRAPHRVTPELVATLRTLIPLAPDHLPQALATIEAVSRAFPTLPQVACFDTAFHRAMPPVAQLYALPRELREAGVLRYGFHGLSYEYVMQALRALDPTAAEGRVIVAHLGNGASMAAVRGGHSVETTMGFTPAGGLVMGTRTGDLDPGVLLYLLAVRGMTPAALNDLVNRQAGLLGVSGTSADMRDLLARESGDAQAAEAVALFCYQAQKFVGALAAALGGVDTLVFTAGIGEGSAVIRERICTGLGFLGVRLDPRRNAAHAAVISADGSPVNVRVLPTNEDLMIARHTYRLLAKGDNEDADV